MFIPVWLHQIGQCNKIPSEHSGDDCDHGEPTIPEAILMSNDGGTVKLLSMEQQFTLRKYQAQVKDVSRDELEDLFLEVMRQKMAQENVFKDLMRQG